MAQHLRDSPYQKMPDSHNDTTAPRLGNTSIKVILSYVLDWVILIAVGVISYLIGDLEPHKRPFPLSDPNISLPYSEEETVPMWLLGIFFAALPIVVILIVTFVFVPGATAPRHMPRALLWRRKLWELHVGLLGLATANIIAFFFTQGMKNLFGKPRPDLLDRCQPDLANAEDYALGGYAGEGTIGQLYSASICQQEDSHILYDGFRSYPSGHSSAAAAGLVYLSLFLASKFAVVIPFILPGASSNTISHTAFPSRMANADPLHDRLKDSGDLPGPSAVNRRQSQHNAKLQSLRNQAAAPPLYLLAIVIAPFALSIYISASRWFDFRHHGFDILFGYIIGLIPAVYCFRYYHLPISEGAGWAWGPRSSDRAFWAGVGRLGYKSQEADESHGMRSKDVDYEHEEVSVQPGNVSGAGPYSSQPYGTHAHASHGPAPGESHESYAGSGRRDEYFDIEMQGVGRRS